MQRMCNDDECMCNDDECMLGGVMEEKRGTVRAVHLGTSLAAARRAVWVVRLAC